MRGVDLSAAPALGMQMGQALANLPLQTQQAQLGALKIGQEKQAMEKSAMMNSILSQAGGDLDAAIDLASEQAPQLVMELKLKKLEQLKANAEFRKEEAATTKLGAETEKLREETKQLKLTGGIQLTEAGRKRKELLNQGYSDDLATGVAYGMYREVTDPATGSVLLVDVRNNVPLAEDKANRVRDELAASKPVSPAVLAQGSKKADLIAKEKTAISDALRNTKLGEIDGTLSRIERQIVPLMAVGEDVPGFGLTGKVPDFFVSTEGKNLRQDVQKFFNLVLNERSGAAVTDPEARRLMTEFAVGKFSATDQQLMYAFNAAREAINTTKSDIAAGYSDAAVEEWNAAAGTKLYKEGAKPPSPLSPTEDQIQGYMKKYPGRSREDIIKAFQRTQTRK